jgi:flagellar assembly protein FliH
MEGIDQEVKEYKFKPFQDHEVSGDVQGFELKELSLDTPEVIKRKQEIIKIEREQSSIKSFDISPIVEEHRGLRRQEEEEKEDRIADEVAKRVAKIEEEAYRKGYEEGVKTGRQDIFDQTRAATEEKMIALSEMISQTLSTQEEILKHQKKELYTLVRNLSKWVILRELKEDGQYLPRLLEKLVIEAGVKSNLLIQVDQKYFEQMPEVLETVQAKLGEFVNVRVESDYDIQGTGIVLQSENGIINGTLQEQFNSIDKLFETVGINNEDGNEVLDDGTE